VETVGVRQQVAVPGGSLGESGQCPSPSLAHITHECRETLNAASIRNAVRTVCIVYGHPEDSSAIHRALLVCASQYVPKRDAPRRQEKPDERIPECERVRRDRVTTIFPKPAQQDTTPQQHLLGGEQQRTSCVRHTGRSRKSQRRGSTCRRCSTRFRPALTENLRGAPVRCRRDPARGRAGLEGGISQLQPATEQVLPTVERGCARRGHAHQRLRGRHASVQRRDGSLC
jgi:hypothetical protein